MILIPQLFVTIFVGVCYFSIAKLMTDYDGITTIILLPIAAVVCTMIALIPLLVIGWPIRYFKAMNKWWRKYWWISIVLALVAHGMLYFSWLPEYRIKVMNPELQQELDSFHPSLSIGGWMLFLFSTLHFFPPFPKRKRDTLVKKQ